MNTKLLKQKILDLAIRGKLTQQLKSDGTAADLLKEISEAKSALSQPKGKKSKDPEQIIPLDKSEAPFEIPANWEWVRLKDLTTLLGDGLHGSPKYCENGDYYFVNGNNLDDGKIVIKAETKKVDFVEYQKYRKELNSNTILVSINGTIGNIAFYKDEKIILGKSACFFNLVSPELKQYIYCLLKTSFFLRYALAEATGSTIKNVSLETMRNFLIPLPPLAEQQRIVAKIEEAFAEIDAVEKNKELLKTHIKQTRQKILDLAIHGKLVPQNKSDEPASVLLERITRDNPHYEKMGLDERRETKDERDSNYKRHSREGGNLPPMLSKDEVPFEVPENWCWCRLGDICNKLIDGDHNPPKGLDYVTKYMMLSSRNINDNDIVDLENVRYLSKEMFEEENQRTKLEEGDILFTSVGSLGRSCIFSGDGKYCFQRSVSLIHTNIYNKYLKYFFDSNYYQKYIVENATGTAQMGFYLEQMRKSFIAIPPLAEQSRIVAKIEELFAELDLVLQNV
jgi:type I restriction enzyme S subunit